MHPDAAKQDAIINGTFNADFPARSPNFIENQYNASLKRYGSAWGNLPENQLMRGSTLRKGAKGARVRALHTRLGLNGDVFGNELANRISHYRRDHGLPNGSHADNILVNSLNRGFKYYLQKIAINKYRAAELPSNLGEKFVLVDAANQLLYMYEGGTIVDQMRVIVGKKSSPTPMLAGFLRFSVLNPYWNVPSDLTRDRYAQRVINGGKNYLRTRRFEALSGWEENARILRYEEVDWHAVKAGERKLRLRQRPGPGNGMGDIKFMFPNSFA